MQDTKDYKPKPKFTPRVNFPYTVTFEIEPVNAKPIYNEEFKSTSYMYFIKSEVEELVWFASERIHQEILATGIVKGATCKVVKEDVPGKKYFLWWFYDVATGEKLNGKAAKPEPPVKNELEEYLAPDDNYSDEVLAESDKMIQKTVKTITDKEAKINLVLGYALQSLDIIPLDPKKPGFNGKMKEIKVRAKELIKAHQELMTE